MVLVLLQSACGRVSFGYPVVSCEDVLGDESFLADDHCYTLHTTPLAYSAAANACNAIAGHLVTLTTASETSAVIDGFGLGTVVRMGLGSQGGWEWVTSEAILDSRWGAGEPFALTNCGPSPLTGGLVPDGSWKTECYESDLPFVCEIEPWRIDAASGHGYRVTYRDESWFDAKTTCEESGGYLATITSFEEMTFVASSFEANNPNWIGAVNPGGGFEWITGEPFSAFTAWANMAPDDPAPSCVRMGNAWDDDDCTRILRAICEREPE